MSNTYLWAAESVGDGAWEALREGRVRLVLTVEALGTVSNTPDQCSRQLSLFVVVMLCQSVPPSPEFVNTEPLIPGEARG